MNQLKPINMVINVSIFAHFFSPAFSAESKMSTHLVIQWTIDKRHDVLMLHDWKMYVVREKESEWMAVTMSQRRRGQRTAYQISVIFHIL